MTRASWLGSAVLRTVCLRFERLPDLLRDEHLARVVTHSRRLNQPPLEAPARRLRQRLSGPEYVEPPLVPCRPLGQGLSVILSIVLAEKKGDRLVQIPA